MFSQLADYVSSAWWSYPLVLGLAYADVLIPLAPNETAVITGRVLASWGDVHLSLPILGAWAPYPAGLGYFGGKAFERAPWKGLLLAFRIALAVTGGVEGVRWLRRRRSRSA